MHLFLVNDDGIGSKGIMALARAAVAHGHRVTLCAPAHQQSAASQRITLADPIFVAPYPTELPGLTAYAIAGTPTDCVRLGLQNLLEEPVDVLISGINKGYNCGMAVHYSGTVAAAREGALHGLHSMAVSIHQTAPQELIDRLAAFAVQTAESFRSLSLPPVALLNINAPSGKAGPWKAPVLAPLCTANFIDGYIRRESPRAGTYYWMEADAQTDPPIPGSDHALLRQGHVTLTFLGNPTEFNADYQGFAAACQTLATPL